MLKAEIKTILGEASNEKKICNTWFKYDAYYWNLIPLLCGEQLFLAAEEDDFALDGYTIRRYKDIKNIKLKNDKCDEILRREGVAITVPEIDIESWHTVFQSLKSLNKNIIVEKETLDGEGSQFVVGKIENISKNFIWIYHFDADGIWDKEPTKCPYNEITSVSFATRYVDIFSKYVGEPN